MKIRNYLTLLFIFNLIIGNGQNGQQMPGYYSQVDTPQNVRYLVVYENEVLDKRIKDFTSLTKIHFENPKGKKLEVPKQFKELTKLRSVSILGSEIEEIPEQLFFSKEIKYVEIHCPALKRLPSSIYKIENLIKLDIENSQKVVELSNNIGKLKDLEVLNLAFTAITNLPESVTELVNLRSLEYGNSTHAIIPKDIHKLVNLKWLTIRGRLNKIPDNIYKMINLENIAFSGSGIKMDIDKICNILNLKSYYNSSRYSKKEKEIIKKCNAKVMID